MSIATEQKKETWPRADFKQHVARLRAELDIACRAEKDISLRIEGFQSRADLHGLTLAMSIGKDEAVRLGQEQNDAVRAVNEKRDELRRFQEVERARFYTLRNEAGGRLHPKTSTQFERARTIAAELLEIISRRFGALEEIEREEYQLKDWNRSAKRINETIPSPNANGVPRANGIALGESSRSQIEGMFLADPQLRDLCRAIITTEGEKRQAAEALEETLENAKPSMAKEPPFFDTPIK